MGQHLASLALKKAISRYLVSFFFFLKKRLNLFSHELNPSQVCRHASDRGWNNQNFAGQFCSSKEKYVCQAVPATVSQVGRRHTRTSVYRNGAEITVVMPVIRSPIRAGAKVIRFGGNIA